MRKSHLNEDLKEAKDFWAQNIPEGGIVRAKTLRQEWAWQDGETSVWPGRLEQSKRGETESRWASKALGSRLWGPWRPL